MVDGAEVEPGAKNTEGVLVERAATGWDPYEVWLTRIRPRQHLIGQRSADTCARKYTRTGSRVFGYAGALVSGSRIMREVRILLGLRRSR